MPGNLLDHIKGYINESFMEHPKYNEFTKDNKNRKAIFVMVDGWDLVVKSIIVSFH